MSYTRPSPSAVSFDWSGEDVYVRYGSDQVNISWDPESYTAPTLPLDATWAGTSAYTAPALPLGVTWELNASASATGAITFSATATASVKNTEASATGAIEFGAIATGSAIRGASALGAIQTAATATAIVLPQQITGITYTATVSSLAFSWSPDSRADSYIARLYREGVLVETQTPMVATATFLGLEDGITYVVEVSGVNAGGAGASGVLSASTAYIAPTAPTGLQQEGEHWVLAKVVWTAPPEKVTFYESIVQIDEPLWEIHKGIIDTAPTWKLYGLPKAAQTYRWRIRSGNPGGLSAWAEIDITTRAFVIDSRLAVLPAAYQEDYLFPDTWDGGTDFIADNVGDPQVSRGLPVFGDQPPLPHPAMEPVAMQPVPFISDWDTRFRMPIASGLSAEGVHPIPFMNDWIIFKQFQEYSGTSDEASTPIPFMGDWTLVPKMYITDTSSSEGVTPIPFMSDWTIEVPQ